MLIRVFPFLLCAAGLSACSQMQSRFETEASTFQQPNVPNCGLRAGTLVNAPPGQMFANAPPRSTANPVLFAGTRPNGRSLDLSEPAPTAVTAAPARKPSGAKPNPVSYTHLTLPTIYSV